MFYKLGLAGALAITTATGAHALSVTPTEDATTLAQTILGTGVTLGTVTFDNNWSGLAAGTFTDGSDVSSGFIDEGIILTSGAAAAAVGPNDSDGFGAASNPGTFSSLEIEFTTDTGALFFDYVWASEEYNEFVDSAFNDTFEFLVSGPGITGTENIALIPGTNQPVEIDTVNNGDNSQFYNDNDPSDLGTPTPFDIQYDGFTDVFTATIDGLQIGEVYTLELIVSDTGDANLDSAVFIAGGTFGGVDPGDPNGVIPLPASLPLILAGLGAFGVVRRRQRN